jgi:hypothetical protein
MPVGGLFHPIGHRGGKERGLPGRRGAAEDALDIGRKATIEHLIGFVEHEVAHLVEPERTLVQHVEHAAGGSDDHLRTLPQHQALRTGGATTEQKSNGDTATLDELLEDIGHLGGELACGGENEHLHGLDRRIDQLHGGNAEGKRLAGPGAGLANDIMPIEQGGNGLFLNGCGCFDAHFFEGTE